MTAMGSCLHIVRVDIDPSLEDAFNTWYEQVHIPALLGCPGWLSARRYVSLDGGPKYAAVYEVAGPWVYETAEFHAVKGFMEFEPHVSNFLRLRLRPVSASDAAAAG